MPSFYKYGKTLPSLPYDINTKDVYFYDGDKR